jgi:hypothetical protein
VEFAFLNQNIEPLQVYPREVWGELGAFIPFKDNTLGCPREVWGELTNYH